MILKTTLDIRLTKCIFLYVIILSNVTTTRYKISLHIPNIIINAITFPYQTPPFSEMAQIQLNVAQSIDNVVTQYIKIQLKKQSAISITKYLYETLSL